ncbi:hypothetical protein LTS18_006736 [Coniosporium uncinatum]|uniref:Uncharacterized protein n=1 Tax=Coniosporium uncinatum TaxID=93489 RepID=A0ACC3DCN7_9PEZI|nr:hypothetical protein LTS18_006736 [Coniosporium uncinatum]
MGEQADAKALDDVGDSKHMPAVAFPGTDEVWKESPLGPIDGWSSCLRSFTQFTSTLPHPAAIYWGQDLILVHNDAWKQAAGGDTTLGKSHVDELSKETVSILRATIVGRTARSVQCHHLLQNWPSDHNAITLSPLIEKDEVGGVVAQLFLSPSQFKDETTKQNEPDNKDSPAEYFGDGFKRSDRLSQEATDNFALQEHPFFQRFAEMLPLGLAILNQRADAIFVNNQFSELTTHQGSDKTFRSWPQTIHPEDYDRVMQAYQEAFRSSERLRTEFRAQGKERPWRLLLLTPLGHNDLGSKSLMQHGGYICAVVDITAEKDAELAQKKAAKEAQDRKDQQERFVDMISHEIRNPLSATLHLGESILDAVKNHEGSDIPRDEIIEAADTIMLCVSHQKNIVDDILSFSKLDSSILSLAPKSCRPKFSLAESLKMFQAEIKKQNMEFDYSVDFSYRDHGIDWVKADMLRINQEDERKIAVAIGASKQRPTSYPPNVVFFDSEDLGFRETMYILVAVKDTGIGISPEGQARLFERFRQATPKTEETYGGSGLGLNISRKLCQLHGGEIGVGSKEGVGSTFGFFFKTRRTDHPQDHTESDDAVATSTRELQMRFLEESEYVTEEPINEKDVPSDLQEPPLEHVPEVSDSGSMDSQYEETAQIAEQVDSKPADEYQINQRPAAPEQIKSYQKFRTKSDSESPAEKVEANKQRARQPTVLLVEDNIINQRILRKKLEAKGFTVTVANNGKEAVDFVTDSFRKDASNTQYACILMDQEMPVMDGNAATQAIRDFEGHEKKQGNGRRNRILGVTANVRGEQKEGMIKAGMDDIIHKPYKIEEIIAKIRELMDQDDMEKTMELPMR